MDLDHKHALSWVIQQIKGESSYWINKNALTQERFEWQTEYYAVSVNKSHLRKVRLYIKNQEQHHKKNTWDDEYINLIENYGFRRHPGIEKIIDDNSA